ncbi:MAG: hypothetical protein V4592_04095 [Bacteroidota bacterium]
MPEALGCASESRGKFLRPVVLYALQGKGLCGKGSIFAVLNFATFFQEKVVGRCGYGQTNFNNAQPIILWDCHAIARNDNTFYVADFITRN